MTKPHNRDEEQGVSLSRDELLLKLLKTPPQPRPKRERNPKRKSKKQAPTKK